MDKVTRSVVSALVVTAAALAVAVFGSSARSEVARRPRLAPVPEAVPPRPPNDTDCNYQSPQDFLIRKNFVLKGRMTREERLRRSKIHEKSIEYRTKNYGYFEGFGRRSWNPRTPLQNAMGTTFYGLKVRVNKRIVPLLACVEQQLHEECDHTGYRPKRLSGIRDKNTYHNNEVSNHVYGIGFDIDPTLNTCCGCVGRWAEHPLCKRDVDSIFDRMAMPECWVHVFERFGFYWLGRDPLQDTMHFEFLGRPEYILKSAGPPPDQPSDGDAGPLDPDGGPAKVRPGHDGGPAAAPAAGGDAGARQGDAGAARDDADSAKAPPRSPRALTTTGELSPAADRRGEAAAGCGCSTVEPRRAGWALELLGVGTWSAREP